MNEFQHSTNVAVFHLIKPAKKFYNFYWLSQTGSDMGKSTVTNSYQAAVNYSTPNEIPDKVLLSSLSLSNSFSDRSRSSVDAKHSWHSIKN